MRIGKKPERRISRSWMKEGKTKRKKKERKRKGGGSMIRMRMMLNEGV